MKRVVWLVFLLGAGLSLAQEGGTPNSEWYVAGTTSFDYQSSGTNGKQIAVASNGDVLVTWQDNDEWPIRRVLHNRFLAAGDSLYCPYGVIVNELHRGGYPNVVAMTDSRAVVSYHRLRDSRFVPCLAAETSPVSLSFPWELDFPNWSEVDYLWPRIDIDGQDRVHVVTSINDADQGYYCRAVPYTQDSTDVFFEFGNCGIATGDDQVFPTIDVACSRTSNRVAIAWIADPPGDHDAENIWLKISEDAGENWSDPIAVTGIPPIDTMCVINGGDWRECNADTFRPWHDLSIAFDNDDNVHIAFSASGYYYFDENGEANPARTYLSTIWHWSEWTGDFTLIGQAWHPHDSNLHSANDLMCQKPSLAIDTVTGYMYCGFQQFDRRAYSVSGYPMGEFYLSKSWDLGASWTLPINVSNTPGDTAMPENGDHPSERDITLAKYVTDGTVHAQYIHDRSAGSTPWFEGETTLNEVVYMRVPDSDLPWLPLQEQWQFRATGTSANEPPQLPRQFTLYQNYPNPFNPSTTIQFDLAKAGNVKLAVFDVTGRAVATLVDGAMSAGAHSIEFDGANLTSGVYFARLEMGGTSQARKMALIK